MIFIANNIIMYVRAFKPKYIKITKDGAPLKNETTEHMNEDDLIMLECESGGGKPIPTVEWWNGTEKMDGTLNIFPESNGIGTARHSHKIVLTRGDLSAKYECRAYNDALNYPLISWVQMDVNVRPYAMEMAKAESPSHQGQMVNLSCIVRGAKPEATVTWFNGTEVLSKTPESDVPPQRERYLGIKQTSHSHGDGTYDTVSTLQFFASRFENDVTFSYPPIVMVNASNLVVNETSDILIFCTYEANPATLKSIKWLQDGRLVDINKDHYEGGTIDQTTLTIKNSTRDDNGNYSCELANQVNSSMSLNVVPISVYFKPTVRLRIHPIKPIKEIDELNATLLCDVESGNPMKLETVRWYLDGKFLKEIPDCSPNSTFCDNNLVINKLILERVTRGFIGNYSCEGKNAAGWGERSPDAELIVYYPPGAAKLEYEPSRVVKGGMVTLTCSVARNGLPSSTEFHWYRGNQLIPQEKGPVWIIHSVTLETKANFTCQAVNAGGEGLPDTKYIDVYAPPQFIKRPSHYTGVLLNSQTVNISCRVECYPLCEIEWLKNYRKMDFRMPEINERYAVEVTNNPPDLRTNDFESIESTLILKMDAWPNGQLDPTLDNVNYTCQSTSNEVGQGVKSTTQFGVEYPPDGLRVSKEIVNVIEKNMPEKIVCSAKAFPEPGYSWAKEDDPNNTLSKTNSLSLNVPISRKHAGNYICTATNRHGSNTAKTILNVMYRPECGIVQSQRDGKIVLTCSATGNPSELDFKWSVKNENETITEGVAKFGNHSDLTLESSSESFRTYLCYAINSVGTSLPCALDVTGSVSWWYALFEHDHLIILLVIIIGLIILVIIICVIIIIICRRKRTADKCPASKDKNDLSSSPNDALLQPDGDKVFYENLPFHGMQNPPNKESVGPSPFKAQYSDLDYADVDYKSYGPINYKSASIHATQPKLPPNNEEDLL
ncbi:hypothetical protein M8J75_005934 [Diaphorina citri]|nr:hypothetical protein M8J75_005934 [Diaphorina citri]